MSAGGARESLWEGADRCAGRGFEVEWSRQKDSYVLEGGSLLEYRSKSCAGAGVIELEERLLVCPCRLAIVVLGEDMRLRRPCNVDVEEVGDPA